MPKVKPVSVGNSTGLILPKEVLGRLNLEKGDHVMLTETKDGYETAAHDDNFEEIMASAKRMTNKYRWHLGTEDPCAANRRLRRLNRTSRRRLAGIGAGQGRDFCSFR